MMVEGLDWERVGNAVADRIDEMHVLYTDIVDASGVSDLTIRNIVNAQKPRYRRKTLGDLSRALGWPPDGIERIGQGEEPPDVAADVIDPAANLAPLLADVLEALQENTAELRRLNERGGRGGRP